MAHVKSGYKSSRYDAEWDYSNAAAKKYNPDIGTAPIFTILPTVQLGDLYISVDIYPAETVPTACSSGTYTNAKYNTMDGARTRPIVYMAVYSAT